MIEKIALIVFFLFYGVNHFYPISRASLIIAISAIVVGIAMIVN